MSFLCSKPQPPRLVTLTFFFIVLLLMSSLPVVAQTSATDGKTPAGLAPGTPAGSYALSGFDDVNLFNGNLNFSLPLINVNGRGGAGYTITLAIDQRWRTVSGAFDLGGGNLLYYSSPEPNWWTGIEPGYGPGVLQARSVADGPMGGCAGTEWYTTTMTRLTFTTSNGTEVELKDQNNTGRPLQTSLCYHGNFSRGTVFTASDGSAISFESDFAIHDDNATPGPLIYGVTGNLKFPDGTIYRVQQGLVTSIRDRNGNRLTFTYGTNMSDPVTFQRVLEVKDSLNRLVTISYANNTTVFYDTLTFKGFNGATRTIKVWRSNLANVMRTTQPGDAASPQTYQQLFPEIVSNNFTHNPLVISSLELPNGQHYDFRYNQYNELARVILPTGGAIEYDYTPTSGIVCQGLCDGSAQIYRRVVERRVYADGTNLEGKTKFTATSVAPNSVVQVDALTPGNVLLSRSKHYFYGDAAPSLFLPSLYLPPWKEGREYQTEHMQQNGTTVLRRITHTWQQRAPVSWWPLGWQGTSQNDAPANDPRRTETVTTLVDTSQVSKQVFGYDDTVPFNNQNNIKEYDWGSGAAGPLRRETRITYITSSTYTGGNVHLRTLQSQVSIYDGTGVERSRTGFEYDNYVTDTNHAALTDRFNVSGWDSAFTTSYTTRGNITTTTRYLLSGGSPTGSVATFSQYDIVGNVVKTIDARGNAISLFYTDCFGAGNGEARLNSAPTELAGQSSFAYVTKVTNALGHSAYSQYDFYLAQPVDGEDANGFVTSGFYNDSLDRPTIVRRAAGTALENQTTYSYDDTNRIVTSSTDRTTNNDNLVVTKIVYDQLGRVAENRLYEGGSNYIATQTQYDALGRAFKTSYPFRPWQSETAVWTTQSFDALGRVVSVTTPDNAPVSNSYSGNTVTVTDPAGKAKKTVTDALGRLSEVYEDPSGLNYQTTYLYDVLDDLVRVTQGTQQRFFMYDSLKRLIRVRNPEQSTNAGLALSDPITGNGAWSVGYQYDGNANLTQKTDARGVVSTFVYDALNRNTTIDYSDTASINPDVKWFYDGATNGKGRFWYFYTGGDISVGSNVEHKAIDSYDALGRPLVQRQLYKLNGTWGPTYQISRGYNLAGGVTSQTYPSGHAVSYAYDTAGRTTSFSGNLGDGVSRTYASSFIYNARSQVTQELFGTQTPLYHKLQYNIRGQLWDVRVATGSDVNGSWNRGCLQFFYESTLTHGASGPDNNGNVLKSSHYIPLDDTSTTWAIPHQLYTYDSLNRLTSVSDYFVSSSQANTQTALQSYSYNDRWGNRTINPASWGTGINTKQFTVDPATNRLGVPVGQTGVMSYDNAGNVTTDTYTGSGNRTYDAENRMLTATDFTGQTSRYTYDAEGHRTRRQVASSQEEWQIYGMDGELIAEYRASSPASAPQKEYGYRDGQLLITATGRFNVALAANGAVATASSTATGSGFSTTGAINGNYRGPWGNSVEGWNDNTPGSVPDWIQVDFAGSKTIDEISVFGLHDNYTVENTPTETQTFTLYGLIAFDVQYWNGSAWTTIPGGNVTGNNKVWRKFTFSPITTNKIRVTINTVPDSWSRVVEIQAFGTSAGGEKVQWLVPDILGTPRIVLDQTGSLANVKRHDYLPFGEELFAGTGGRTVAHGYAGDGVRQQFTSKERDVETGLDYFGARYYASLQGRFSSPDPLHYTETRSSDPQQFNLYSYVRNSPLTMIDPDGRDGRVIDPTTAQNASQADREQVQRDLQRLAPGTTVDNNGVVHKAGFFRRVFNHLTGRGAGTALVSRMVNSSQTTHIGLINGTNDAVTVSVNQAASNNAQPADALILYDRNATIDLETRTPDANGRVTDTSPIQALPTNSALTLAHELIHAVHIMDGTINYNPATRNFFEGSTQYRETAMTEEFRTVGFRGFTRPGDITENRIRKQLGMNPRATYVPRPLWTAVPPPQPGP